MTRNPELPEMTGEPRPDPALAELLGEMESQLVATSLDEARQAHRIGLAIRHHWRTRRNRVPQLTWWDWIARAARPLPIGMAAVLALAALIALRSPGLSAMMETAGNTPDNMELPRIVSTGGSGADVLNLLIPPTTSDSLLARAFAEPLAIKE